MKKVVSMPMYVSLTPKGVLLGELLAQGASWKKAEETVDRVLSFRQRWDAAVEPGPQQAAR